MKFSRILGVAALLAAGATLAQEAATVTPAPEPAPAPVAAKGNFPCRWREQGIR